MNITCRDVYRNLAPVRNKKKTITLNNVFLLNCKMSKLFINEKLAGKNNAATKKLPPGANSPSSPL